MAEVKLNDVSRQLQNLFDKGLNALTSGNLPYALDLLNAVIEQEPAFLEARRALRLGCIKQASARKVGALGRKLAETAKMPAFMGAQRSLKSGNLLEALTQSEKLLQDDPFNLKYALLFAEAAAASGIPEAGAMTLTFVSDNSPGDPKVLTAVGGYYASIGDSSNARQCYEQVCVLRPDDPDALKRLKDIMAVDSMASDGWDEMRRTKGSFRDVLKDSDEAASLEREKKSVKSDRDADSLIDEARRRIESEPKNINYYRALAKVYAQQLRYPEAIETLKAAVAINPGDPELDRAVGDTHVEGLDWRIKTLEKEGAPEEEILAVRQERVEFVFADLQDRVERYPNDANLRFDWGCMLFENDYFNEAIQQFQSAQRSARNRVQSLYYLGLCFKAKGQHDMAIDQLTSALAELLVMDATKKDVLYELGTISELRGDSAAALLHFKEIYQADIGYRDVAAKVESGYAG
jgi:tetratricopeptide (TPR) repeat protein